VRRAAKGGILSPEELLHIGSTLLAARLLRAVILRRDECVLLARHARSITTFEELEQKIDRCLAPSGEVKDSASDELRRLRRQILSLHDDLRTRLEAMLRTPRAARMLQEPVIIVRAERHCLPVRSEFKHDFPGIVHDASASGATVFMEPLALVGTGNELAAARRAEQEEVRRILQQLSSEVGSRAEAILATMSSLGQLDFIFARGHLGRLMNASEPDLNQDRTVDLRQAHHPLLSDKAVPIDVRVGEDFITLVITGPNTGGKTVTLKTMGLLALMAQSGLHIPALPGSRVCVFKKVFADVGDEQSIEQSLSTFSSHMSQIVSVLGSAGADSFVLLDELGAGTDPAEGAALAKAILSELHRRGCRTVATTHSSDLKAFAYAQPGMENACVEFDPVTLQPTYKVSVGLPGSSNAFAIAAHLGMPADVLEFARQSLDTGQTTLQKALEQLEIAQHELMRARAEAEKERAQLQIQRAQEQKAQQQMEAERQAALRKARRQAEELLNRTRQQAEQLLEGLREEAQQLREQTRPRAAERQAAAAERQAEHLIEGIQQSVEEIAPAPRPAEAAPQQPDVAPREVRPGDLVFVRPVLAKGTVLSGRDEQGQIELQVGLLKVRVKQSEVEPLPEPEPGLPTPSEPVEPEIRLRGLRVHEAVASLESYLERALLAGLKEVRIIHGRGTGAVKRATLDLLRGHPYVSAWREGRKDEGGAGCTVATLAQ
jgi:DNA mismatch repair protein MutS2